MDHAHPVQQRGRYAVGEEGPVVVRDGHAERGARQFAGQQMVFQEDVVRMRGEAERDAQPAGRNHGRRRRVGGPMGVQMAGLQAPDIVQQRQGAPPGDQALGQGPRLAEEATHDFGEFPQRARWMAQNLGPRAQHGAPGRSGVDHPVQQGPGVGLHQSLARRFQRHDAHVHAEFEQFVDLPDDERLRPARKQGDEVDHPHGRSSLGWVRCGAGRTRPQIRHARGAPCDS
ncbi:hypothetical protein GALL_386980 [mine drainage metagenome]|uniref:Uncharacterized protein n=1 Tax=mine drainage metagenome TaxID=410659 RepID=A0A1J5QHU2_9ZZZZ